MADISILFVEDNPGDVLLLKTILQSIGLEDNHLHFKNGEEALAYLEKTTSNPYPQNTR